jgi:hypothetical protein
LQEIAFYKWKTCEIRSEAGPKIILAIVIYDAKFHAENISSLLALSHWWVDRKYSSFFYCSNKSYPLFSL